MGSGGEDRVISQTGAEPRGALLTGRRRPFERAAAASGGRQRERIRRSHEYCGTWTQAACVPGGALPGAASFPSVRRALCAGKSCPPSGALGPWAAGFALAWRRAWRGLWEQAGSGFRFSGKRRCAPGKRASELHALSGSAQGSSEMGRRERSAESGESGERAWSERAACLRGVPASSLISSLCSPLFPLFGG